MSNKIAIVLFVKNEQIDLPGWIAWHLISGFDTLIIYEDKSSDGTAEIIDVAGKHYDVRRRSVPESLFFQHRQQAVYLHAAQTLRDEFDWVGFIDADEYVYLPNHPNAHDFFAEFDESVGAIALNWCCYGSGWHVLRPGPNVPEQFEYRSNPDFFENNTVKSFVRIKQMKPIYQDPHRFEVLGETVNPLGETIKWTENERHRINHAPDWSNGCILHYAIRSAEHYIEKVKRRSDIRNNVDIGFFSWWDKNDDKIVLPAKKMDLMNEILYDIQHSISLNRFISVKKHNFLKLVFPTAKYRPYKLKSYFDTRLYTVPETGKLVHAKHEKSINTTLQEVVLFISDDDSKLAFMTSLYPEKPKIYIFGEAQVSSCIAFRLNKIDEERIAIQSFTRKKYLTCINENEEGTNRKLAKVSADWAKEWETFTLLPSNEVNENSKMLLLWENILNLNIDIEHSSEYLDCYRMYLDYFSACIATLPFKERNAFLSVNQIEDFPWLSNVDTVSF